MNFRVGFGFDVHPLKENHPFYLGGIRLESAKGAAGHSDADVLLHALCDALLGAAGLRDIGFHFPNTDPQWKGKDSRYFLQEVMQKLKEKGWQVVNVDCTVCLERPKINPHIPAMKAVLAPLLGIGEDAVSIKATTNEQLGYVGREEGVCAYAVCLIQQAL
ncbi:MAG: 2-C-methyl-D-erythritol 2,4-cyclodiphosphate synthase [Cyclobacteriaceae bacterium]|nr:2-C-methyl-D-erythritol 2,4-cyclodiphosphate synthase [Cyclobacteriaceae bacterium]MCX7638066.1 2-C-methyl-D-erythritol 2,4-cyclodiphosphate synthase [Cyclobacteriaceae bacterium]MDW8331931.1 2-C-methyl-D-erythritol 2,4-cyclodiphosphate synthase [Cyclobacteriaceae bacterium]